MKSQVLEIAQDAALKKQFLRGIGVPLTTEERLAALEQRVFGRNQAKKESPTNMVLRRCSEHYNVSLTTMMGKARWADASYARYAAMWIMRDLLQMSKAEIAKAFNRTHGSICFGLETINGWMQNDTGIRAKMEQLRDELAKKISKDI